MLAQPAWNRGEVPAPDAALPPGGGPQIFATSEPERTPGALAGAGEGAPSSAQREKKGEYAFALIREEESDWGTEL